MESVYLPQSNNTAVVIQLANQNLKKKNCASILTSQTKYSPKTVCYTAMSAINIFTKLWKHYKFKRDKLLLYQPHLNSIDVPWGHAWKHPRLLMTTDCYRTLFKSILPKYSLTQPKQILWVKQCANIHFTGFSIKNTLLYRPEGPDIKLQPTNYLVIYSCPVAEHLKRRSRRGHIKA